MRFHNAQTQVFSAAIRRFALLFCAFALLFAECPRVLAESGLPIVKIDSDDPLTGWKDKQDVRSAVLTFQDDAYGLSFTCDITLRPQGNSSIELDKKNFIVKAEPDIEFRKGWGAHSKYCLKANYLDCTAACNIVSNRLAAEMNAKYGLFDDMVNYGQIDGFPVWLTVNGRDAGLYTWNIHKATWTYNLDRDNPDHILMSAEDWTESTIFNSADGDAWIVEEGCDEAYAKAQFRRLQDFVVNSDDETFKRHFDEYLNLDACLNYICFVSVAFATDNLGKNMLMLTKDGQVWSPMLYDLDSLWGIRFTGASYTISSKSEPSPREYMSGMLSYNNLIKRVTRCFASELQARYAELRGDILSFAHIQAAFDDFIAQIPQIAYERNNVIWPQTGKSIRTEENMLSQLRMYLPIVDSIYGYTGDAF